MGDVFTEAFENIGEDFETLMAPVLRPVAVASVNPDTGAVLVSAANVPALKRSRRRFPFTVQDGGLPGDQCRFVFKAARIAATLKDKDTITESGGTAWVVDERGANLIAFGELWTCDVSLKRS